MVKFVQEPARDIPVKDEVDILVVGGGPSGIMAARAAAGKGLKVMLIESRGYVGGNLTIGLPILGFLGRKGNQVVEGLPQMLIDRLRAKGKASEHKPCKNHVSLTIIDSEEVKDVALGMLEEVGVKILFYVFCSDVIKEGNEVKGVKQEVVNASDACIEIPQYGTKHSLNVSTTAGIVIWEFARQLLIK